MCNFYVNNSRKPFGSYKIKCILSQYRNYLSILSWKYCCLFSVSGYNTAVLSESNAVFNAFGNPLTIQSANGNPFSLYAASVAAAWNDNLQLTVVGYRSSVPVVTNTFTLSVFTVLNVEFNGYIELDEVIFSSSGGTLNPTVDNTGTQFGMDNVYIIST